MRESPALDIIHLLEKSGAKVSYSDPHVPSVKLDGLKRAAADFVSSVDRADCVVIVTDHKAFDYPLLVERAKLIVDTRNALKGFASDKIVRL